MGLIAGIGSRDRSDISDLLQRMAIKLRHRGDAPFCVCKKGLDGWERVTCGKAEEISSIKSSFGLVGRHLTFDEENEASVYSDCQQERFLLLDGRIFNTLELQKELKDEHNGNLMSPSVILHLIEELQKKIFNFSAVFGKIFDLLEGMFAAALILKEHLFIFRDLIGIKPLYLYSGPKYVAFASEKKALWAAGLTQRIQPLRPGRVMRVAEKGFTSHYQAEFPNKKFGANQLEYYNELLLQGLRETLMKLNPKNRFYLLLSGGIDSTLLAALLKELALDFNSLVIGTEKSKDIQAAQQAADFLTLPLEVLKFNVSTLEELLPLLIYHVESRDEKKLNIAFPLFHASNYLSKKNYRLVLTGQGADELFGGYKRHEIQFQEDPLKLHTMLWEDVENLYTGNLQRDDAASMANGVELRLPYLNRRFIEVAMLVPPQLKVRPPQRKYILRHLGKSIGLSEKIAQQPKRAIQFSSGSYETLKKLAKRCGFTKNFALKNEFFSPTQLFIDSIAYLLGFPNIDPKVKKFVEKTRINWPDSFLKYENRVNTII